MNDESKYLLDESGKLHRLGVHIATLNAEKEIVFHDPADRSKYAAPVARWLKDEVKRREAAAAAGTPPPKFENTGADDKGPSGLAIFNEDAGSDPKEWKGGEGGAGAPAAAPTPHPASAPQVLSEADRTKLDSRSLAAEGEREAARYNAEVQDDRDFATKHGLPQPPRKHPMQGDKTPAYVEWLKENRPAKFREKYGVKGKAQVPVFRTNPETGKEEHVGYREAEMSTRKTHLTEKEESVAGLGADQSWDA